MATILRDLSYRYQWIYDGFARIAALAVGGEQRFRQLAWQELPIHPDTHVLDLCCGSGQTTQFLVQRSHHVTGLDASPRSLKRAQHNVPSATFVEGWAEALPFSAEQFDVVHTSVALHEMQPDQLQQIFQEVYRVLNPTGVFVLIDFHAPTNPVFIPGLALFLWLFETQTAWNLLKTDLIGQLQSVGFAQSDRRLYAGGSLQVIHARKCP
ncbi:MAG: class I SAM-dependent methyltransferase [Leptolyngbyaceae cyanobacterium SL_7_1]|nr:class I SAM-dependent methyltransferase [Leptolyngbyaceae cyanobacterium SL_7_1]